MADNSFEEILNKITQNPDLMAKISEISKGSNETNLSQKLPEVIAAISPTIASEKVEKNEEKTDTPADEIQKSALNALDLPITKLSEKISKNSDLLLALKPYLNKERGNLIDSIVKMAQVADLMKLIK